MPQAKLPEPVFEEFGFSFRAILSLIAEQPLQLDETTLAIRSALTAQEAKEGLSSQQLADALGFPRGLFAHACRR